MQVNKIHHHLAKFTFIVILIIAITFRFTGLNWDQGNYLHPDERFLTMVITSMKWPSSLQEYLDTNSSPLNPHTIGFNFFVYGTWPLLVIKAFAQLTDRQVYGNIHEIGRFLSASIDTLTVLLVFFTTKRIVNRISYHNNLFPILSGLFAMFIYSILVLPIQLAHFATVDPYVIVSITALLYFLTFNPSWKTGILAGCCLALALAAKISAAPIVSTLILYLFFHISFGNNTNKSIQLFNFILFFCFFFFCLFRFFHPYLFTAESLYKINPKVLNNLKELQSFNTPDAWFPPGVQWINTTSIIFPLFQLVFWGVGIPITIISGISLLLAIKKIAQHIKHFRYKSHNVTVHLLKTHTIQELYPPVILLIPFSAVFTFFAYQSIQYVMPLRYFWPILPSLSILCGIAIGHLLSTKPKKIINIIMGLLLLSASSWPIAYMSIYTQPHTRVQASTWIYNTIPNNSVLSSEHWDDGLPLNLEHVGANAQYQTEELELFAPEDSQKWETIIQKLNRIEYLIISSNRVYGSITSATNKFPQTAVFYYLLFSNQLGFEPVAQFVSRPTIHLPFITGCISVPFFSYGSVDTLLHKHITPDNSAFKEILDNHCSKGIVIIDDYAEESFTVYDHPKVTIFKKTPEYNPPYVLLNQ